MGSLRDALERLDVEGDSIVDKSPEAESPLSNGSGSVVVSAKGVQAHSSPPTGTGTTERIAPLREEIDQGVGDVLSALDRVVERSSIIPTHDRRHFDESEARLDDVQELVVDLVKDDGTLPSHSTDESTESHAPASFLEQIQPIAAEREDGAFDLSEPDYLQPQAPGEPASHRNQPAPGYEDPFANIVDGELPENYATVVKPSRPSFQVLDEAATEGTLPPSTAVGEISEMTEELAPTYLENRGVATFDQEQLTPPETDPQGADGDANATEYLGTDRREYHTHFPGHAYAVAPVAQGAQRVLNEQGYRDGPTLDGDVLSVEPAHERVETKNSVADDNFDSNENGLPALGQEVPAVPTVPTGSPTSSQPPLGDVFDPGMIPGMDPMVPQSVTTDQPVEDPVAVANQITGWYEDDLASLEKATHGESIEEAEYTHESDEEGGESKPIKPRQFELNAVTNLRLPRTHDQYEKIWNEIQDGQSQNTSLMVGLVSVEPETHVSDVIGHLAVMLTREMGSHVLLVDGDLRRRQLSAEFGLHQHRGLSEACMMKCDWTEVVVPTSHKGMCVLPAGTNSITNGDFDPFRLHTMASGWKEMFDVILVDTGDAQAAFAQPLSKACDGSYLVVRLGRTNRKLADDMVESLMEDDVVLKGCIVTNMP